MDMQSVSIIGAGRIGGALAVALSRAGFMIDRLVHRDGSTAKLVSPMLHPATEIVEWSDHLADFDSNIVIIATADPDIPKVAVELREKLKKGTVVIHTSGSLSSESLSVLGEAGCLTAAMHPLISVSDAVSGTENFADAYFCIEGDEKALVTIRAIVEALGGRAFSIETSKKPLYHAAAVTACGHLVALIDIAVEMLSNCGIERQTSKEILLPLISSTVDNLQTQSTANALTGSFARLDVAAIKRHLAAIDRDMSEQVKDVYLLLGERSLELAASNNGNATRVREIREVISIAKRKPG
jgi:predicted short-subunit dehydrogenase-like oxidoreductase (DUF2520 family)